MKSGNLMKLHAERGCFDCVHANEDARGVAPCCDLPKGYVRNAGDKGLRCLNKSKVDKPTVSMIPDERNVSVVATLEEALTDARDRQAMEAFVILRLPDGSMLTLHSGSDDTIMTVGYLRCLEHDILEGRYG